MAARTWRVCPTAERRQRIEKVSEQGGQPERRLARFLSSSRFGRRPVTLVVNTDPARDQRVDRVALFIFAVARRRVSLVVDCFPVA